MERGVAVRRLVPTGGETLKGPDDAPRGVAIEAGLTPDDFGPAQVSGVVLRLKPRPGAAPVFAAALKAAEGGALALVVDGRVVAEMAVPKPSKKADPAITALEFTLPDSAAASALTDRFAPPPPPCDALEPGYGLGPFRRGMTRSEMLKVKRPAGEPPLAEGPLPGWVTLGPYRLQLDGDKVEVIARDLGPGTACLKHNGVEFEADEPVEAVAIRVRSCAPMEIREGGNVIECASGLRLLSGAAGGAAPPEVRVQREGRPRQACEAYAVPGGFVVDSQGVRYPTADQPVMVGVGGVASACVGPRRLSDGLRPGDIERPGCKTTAAKTGTRVACDGVAYLFAGSTGTLASVEVSLAGK